MKKSTYKGQALAIIMVVLVISSIIAFSIIIRSVREKKSTLQERTSAEAYEVVDIILDNMLLYSFEEWNEKGLVLGATQKEEVDGQQNITSLLNNLGSPINLQTLSICPLSGTKNIYTLKLTEADQNAVYTINPGQAFTFIIGGEDIVENCQIEIHFESPIANTGFMLNYVHKDGTETSKIKDYDYEDAETYCISPLSTGCDAKFQKATGVNWHDPTTPFKIQVGTKSNPNRIDKIQLIAINNKIMFKFKPTFNCPKGIFDMVSLRASAACNNTYRAKEVLIPKVRSNYSLFNYVLFNGFGSMLTSQ